MSKIKFVEAMVAKSHRDDGDIRVEGTDDALSLCRDLRAAILKATEKDDPNTVTERDYTAIFEDLADQADRVISAIGRIDIADYRRRDPEPLTFVPVGTNALISTQLDRALILTADEVAILKLSDFRALMSERQSIAEAINA